MIGTARAWHVSCVSSCIFVNPVFGRSRVQDDTFTEEQKHYLKAFIAAIAKRRGIETPTASSSIQTSPNERHPRLLLHSYGGAGSEIGDGGKLVPEGVALLIAREGGIESSQQVEGRYQKDVY
jgi:hypothetical protein